MNIYYETDYGDELFHWGFGSKRQNHKYIERIPIGKNRYRYFYTQAELEAYKAGKVRKTSIEKSNVANNWTSGERAALIATNIIAGGRATEKVADDLRTRRVLKSEKTQLDVMISREKDYRERGEKTRDFELINKANRLLKNINDYEKRHNAKQKKYDKTFVGKADKLISTIGSIPAKAKSVVSKLSKISVKEAITNNPVTKLGRSVLSKILGKKEPERVPETTTDKDLTVNGVKIKIRR